MDIEFICTYYFIETASLNVASSNVSSQCHRRRFNVICCDGGNVGMVYLTTQLTHFYGHIVKKKKSDRQRANPLPLLYGLLFFD